MWEESIILWFNSIGSGVLDHVMLFVTRMATAGLIWICLAIVLFCVSKQYRKTALFMIVSLILAYFITDLIVKPMVCRVRPFEELGLEILIQKPTTSSFPSGHTASSFAAATYVYLVSRRYGSVLLAFATMVGISRIYLLVHWPTDVFAGAVIGIACAYAVHRMLVYFERIEKNSLA